MKARVLSLSLVIVTMLAALVPASVGAQPSGAGGTETSISVTDVLSGVPLVGKHFTTDVQISVTSVVTSEVGVLGAEIWVSFDPTVVTVHDFDGDAGNGTQVEIQNDFFDGSLVVVANEVFYDMPAVSHPTECDTQGCIHVSVSHVGGSGPVTNTTGTVATITWVAQELGSPAIGISVVGTGVPPGSVLADSDGQPIPIDSTSVPDITVTGVGAIGGIVERQGTRTDHAGVEIAALAVGGGVVTTATTADDGSFTLDVPLGGTYSVDASYPGYLHAGKSSVYVAADPVDIGSAKLVGGDVNADNCINILDIVSIIGDFGLTELDASDPQDINDDGTVNILDLTISAGNFSRCGPTAWIP
jgi:hypothetical protein